MRTVRINRIIIDINMGEVTSFENKNSSPEKNKLRDSLRRELALAAERIPSDEEIEEMAKIVIRILFHKQKSEDFSSDIAEIEKRFPDFLPYFKKIFNV